jgi:hypothetical protein
MLSGLFMVGAADQAARANLAQTTGEMAARAASEARAESESIRFDVEKLFMITQALWTILQEQHGYTDEDLMRRVQDIDLQDGKLDGQVARSKIKPDCPKCGRKLMSKRPVCLFCGTAVAMDPFDR